MKIVSCATEQLGGGGLELHESVLRQALSRLPDNVPVTVLAITHLQSGDVNSDLANLFLQHALASSTRSTAEETTLAEGPTNDDVGIWMHPEPILCTRRLPRDGDNNPPQQEQQVALLLLEVKCGRGASEEHDNNMQAVLLLAFSSMLSSLQILSFSRGGAVNPAELDFAAQCFERAAQAVGQVSVGGEGAAGPASDYSFFQRLECWVSDWEGDALLPANEQEEEERLQDALRNLYLAGETMAHAVLPRSGVLSLMFANETECVLLPSSSSSSSSGRLSEAVRNVRVEECLATRALAPKQIKGQVLCSAEAVLDGMQRLCALLHPGAVGFASSATNNNTAVTEPPPAVVELKGEEEEREVESWGMWSLNLIPIVGTCKLAYEAATLYDEGRDEEAKLKSLEAGISLVGDVVTVVSMGFAVSGTLAGKQAGQMAGKQATKAAASRLAAAGATKQVAFIAIDEAAIAATASAAAKRAAGKVAADAAGKATAKAVGKAAAKAAAKTAVKMAAKEAAKDATMAAVAAGAAGKAAAGAAGKVAVDATGNVAGKAASQAGASAAGKAVAQAAAAKAVVVQGVMMSSASTATATADSTVKFKAAVTKSVIVPSAAAASAVSTSAVSAVGTAVGATMRVGSAVYSAAPPGLVADITNNLLPTPPPPAPKFADCILEATAKADCQRIIQLAMSVNNTAHAPLAMVAIQGIVYDERANIRACCVAVVRLVRRYGAEDHAAAEAGCDAVCVLASVGDAVVRELLLQRARDAVETALDNPHRQPALLVLSAAADDVQSYVLS